MQWPAGGGPPAWHPVPENKDRCGSWCFSRYQGISGNAEAERSSKSKIVIIFRPGFAFA
jgi:hypothetical protein